MSKILFNFLIVISVATFFIGCTSEEPQFHITEGNMTLLLNFEKPSFDGDNLSRSVSGGWINGDKLYFRFSSGNSTVTGSATYKQNTQLWDLIVDENLSQTLGGNVEVFYFDAEDIECINNKITLSETIPIYGDYEGIFTLNDQSELVISAFIKPLTSRILMKGSSGKSMTISGFDYISSFNVKSGKFEYRNNCSKITINSDGNSNYIYGLHNDTNREIIICNSEDDVNFYAYTYKCSGSIFTIGHSGWLNTPDSESHVGWSQKCLNGSTNGHKWVDLGLPSGLKWSIENIGADYNKWLLTNNKSDIYGNWYSWGSTKSDLCHYVEFSDYIDVSKYEWGNGWKIPSNDDYYELFQYCSYEWVEGYNNTDVNGALLISEKYGISIFFPAAGIWHNSNGGTGIRQDEGESCWFYTSSYDKTSSSDEDGSVGCAYFFTNSANALTLFYRAHRFSARSVCYN